MRHIAVKFETKEIGKEFPTSAQENVSMKTSFENIREETMDRISVYRHLYIVSRLYSSKLNLILKKKKRK